MIEPMSRITLVCQKSTEDDLLHTLQQAGLVHFNYDTTDRGLRVTQLEHYLDVLEQHLGDVPKENLEARSAQTDPKQDHAFIKELKAVNEVIERITAEIQRLKIEKERVEPLGEFRPETMSLLKKKGIMIHLFKVGPKQHQDLKGLDWFLLFEKKGFYYVAIVSRKKELDLPFVQMAWPKENYKQLEQHITNEEVRLEELIALKKEMLNDPSPLIHLSWQVKNLLEYERTRSIRKEKHELSYITGFVPTERLPILRDLSRQVPFAMLSEPVTDPTEAPTKFRHNAWSKLFTPILKFIGVVPGYGEKDVNGMFLVFFSIFFAMLIGDAGYGLVLMVMLLILRKKKPEIPTSIFTLFGFLSVLTLIWGAITGMWFGYEPLAKETWLRYLIIPSLDSFAEASQPVVIRMCFILGFVQLSMAHLWLMVIKRDWMARATELAWIGFLAGFYFFAEYSLLQNPLPAFTLPLFGGSMALLVLFSEQKGRSFFKGVLMGVAQLPINTLNAIGVFSDLVSYIRLFALGLSSMEMAGAANRLAAGAGWDSWVGIFFGVLILILGHTINLLLAGIAVMVHGIRLNFLECARHLEMEWTGIPYRPFKMAEREA